MKYHYKFLLTIVASLMLALLSACGGDSSHEAADNFVPPDKSIQSITKLAKAAPDECWKQYSGDEVNFPPKPSVPVNGSCAAGQPKTNESYIWGMTKTGDRLWFGTAANVECLVIGTYLDYASNPIIFDTATKTTFQDVLYRPPTTPYVQVCEFGRSWVKAANGALPSALGDWRPPTIFSYRDGEGLVARTAQVDNHGVVDQQRRKGTLGLRSAGNRDGIAFLAGPNIPGDKIFIFAFRQSDGEYLGSHELSGYSNIRKWKVLYGNLYTAVTLSNARADELYQAGGSYKHGRILKWVGTAASPFQGPGGKDPFVEVGELNGGGSELSEYGSNRIAVSTWPGGVDGSGSLNLRKIKPAGISISVPVPAGGLSDAASASNFTEVFTFADYDPDLARAFTYGGGALAYFDGWLVWGSMHVPFTNILALSNTYSYRGLVSSNTQCRDILDPGYAADRQDTDSVPQSVCGEVSGRTTCINNIYSDPATDYGIKASYDACLDQLQSEYLPDYQEATKDMATSIFRGRNLETFAPQIDVLYGYETLKVLYTDSLVDLDALQKATASTRRSWQTRNNGIGRPVFGAAGIGGYDTATCDPATSTTPCRSLGNPKNNYTWEMGVVGKRLYLGTMDQTATLDPLNLQAGADLYSFTSAKRAAVREDATGLGNSYNYGFRTLLTEEPGTLYIGTANPFNLVADGGWELLKIDLIP